MQLGEEGGGGKRAKGRKVQPFNESSELVLFVGQKGVRQLYLRYLPTLGRGSLDVSSVLCNIDRVCCPWLPRSTDGLPNRVGQMPSLRHCLD